MAAVAKLSQISSELEDEIDKSLPAISMSFESVMAAMMQQLGNSPVIIDEAKLHDDWL
jgi:hypothetical protein